MNGFPTTSPRAVASSDLDIFYEKQLDPEAIRMAAFVCADPRDKVAFDAHGEKILASPENTNRTIEADGQVAGHIVRPGRRGRHGRISSSPGSRTNKGLK